MDTIHQTVSNIMIHLELNESDLMEIMEISRVDFSRALRHQSYSKLPITGFFKLSKKLGIGIKNIQSGNIDYEALKEHFKGNKTFIPKRYQHYQNSRIAPSNNLLVFSKGFFGAEVAETIKRELQINDVILADPNQNIGSLLPIDILSKLDELNVKDTSFQTMGSFFFAQRLRPLLSVLPENLNQYLELIFEHHMQTTEKNMSYSIHRVTSTEATIKVETRQDTKDAFGLSQFGGSSYYQYVKGCYAEIMKIHLKLPTSHYLPVTMLSEGDDYYYRIAL